MCLKTKTKLTIIHDGGWYNISLFSRREKGIFVKKQRQINKHAHSAHTHGRINDRQLDDICPWTQKGKRVKCAALTPTHRRPCPVPAGVDPAPFRRHGCCLLEVEGALRASHICRGQKMVDGMPSPSPTCRSLPRFDPRTRTCMYL